MNIKLSNTEWKCMQALDPNKKGLREMKKVRDIGAVVFRKKAEKLDQETIRAVRNALRKPVREKLIEMPANQRGMYRITDRGRKKLAAGEREFSSRFERGQATEAAKSAGQERLKAAGKKLTKKAVPKKAAAKKAAPKKVAKKLTKKAVPKKAAAKKTTKKAAIKVEDHTKKGKTNGVKAKANGKTNGTNGKANGTRRGPPKFKRRRVRGTYADQVTG